MGKIWIKLGISLTILAYILLVKVKISNLKSIVGKVNPIWFTIAISLHIIGYLISGIRWQRISKHLGVRLPLKFYVKSYLVSTFFGFFLPSRFGGDVVRVGDLSIEDKFSSGLSTVFYERVVGLVSMVSLGLPALFFFLPQFRSFFFISLFLMGGVLLASAIVLWRPFLIVKLIPLKKFRKKAQDIAASFKNLSQAHLFTITLLWSFALQINVIIYYWSIGKTVGIGLGFFHYFYIVPTMLILMAIPVSFQGMGVRDYFAVSVFPLYGASPEQGLLFSLVDLSISLFYAVVGFFVYISRK